MVQAQRQQQQQNRQRRETTAKNRPTDQPTRGNRMGNSTYSYALHFGIVVAASSPLVRVLGALPQASAAEGRPVRRLVRRAEQSRACARYTQKTESGQTRGRARRERKDRFAMGCGVPLFRCGSVVCQLSRAVRRARRDGQRRGREAPQREAQGRKQGKEEEKRRGQRSVHVAYAVGVTVAD